MKRFTPLLLLIAAASPLAFIVYAARSSAQSSTEPRRLFDPLGAEKSVAAAGADRASARTAVVREQEVRVNFGTDDFEGARELGLPLFGHSYTAVRSESEGFVASPGGGLVWRGKIHGPGEWSGDVTLSVKGRALSGLIYSPEAVYEIIPQKDFGHLLVQLDQSLFPPCGGALDPGAAPETEATEAATADAAAPAAGASSGDVVAPAAADDGSRIDVLVVYTDDVRAALGGATQADAFAQAAVDTTNTAYINSVIHTRLRLVGTLEVNYAETGDVTAALTWARGDATVLATRNSTRADMVALLVERGATACGVGYLMTNVGPGFSQSSFSATARGCAVGNLTFAHELGHNQGCQHNPENGGPPDRSSYPYAYGHYVNGSFRTIMSYSDPCTAPNYCPKAPHFSNPSVNFNGVPTGIADERDNSRVINNTATAVAQFRDSAASGPPANDNFANAFVIGGRVGTLTGSSGGATREPGEPNHGLRTGGASVWYVWQAPVSGATTITTAPSTFNTLLGVYTGGGFGGLTVVANNDDVTPLVNFTSSVTFNAVAGTTYRIAVDGYFGATGSLTLGWSQALPCTYSITPASQSFTAAGGAGVVSVTAGAGCGWAAASDGGFVQITGGNSGTGDGTIGYAVAANPSPLPRSATFTAAGQTFTVNQEGDTSSSVQLSAPAFSVNESERKVLIAVTRAGATSLPASLDYATADGTASRRGDYTQTLGTLSFAPGETSKTVTVFITDDVYAEGPESFMLTLSNAAGATLGAPASAVVTVDSDDNAGTPAPNPVGEAGFNADFFVRQHYVDFLAREPDAPGLQFWTDEIVQCGPSAQCVEVKRINVSAAFFLSIEFQQTGYIAYRARKAAFGNITGKPVPITREEMLADVGVVGNGVVVGAEGWGQRLEQNKLAYFERLAGSERFAALYPQSMTPEQFVDALNSNAGGALSPAERDAMVADLKGNAKTRAQALGAVAEDEELTKAEFNKAFVLMQFFGYLRRDPDGEPDADFSGYIFWLGKLNEFDGDFIRAEMVKAFISSDEYRKRFGQ